MKIWRKRIAELINESVNDGGVCRTAPATPVLLIRVGGNRYYLERSPVAAVTGWGR